MLNRIRLFAVIMLALTAGGAAAQPSLWKALTAKTDYNLYPNYGVQGQPAAMNRVGVRQNSATWTGADGKLYLFGGYGYLSQGNNGCFNDLWRYDPASGLWTWLSGSSTLAQPGVYGTQGVVDAANIPGARKWAAVWTGADGMVYLFGGYGYDCVGHCSDLNDLWRYNPASGQWTWLKGGKYVDQPGVYGTQGVANPANNPEVRYSSATWTGTDGKLYLFGGFYYSDLWCYDPASNQWTWLKGSNQRDQDGIYGVQGVADPANAPGARGGAATWTGTDGRFYLLGGWGNGAKGSPIRIGLLNDLWSYDPASGLWTWLKGSNTTQQAGVYGSQGVAAAANTPGARQWAAAWTGADGKFYLFGGSGYGSTISPTGWGDLNDFWSYDPYSNQWTWLKGSDQKNQGGTYGTQGVAAPVNIPSGRESSATWTGADGRLYLFGGEGCDYTGSYDHLSDLWCCESPTAVGPHWRQYQ